MEYSSSQLKILSGRQSMPITVDCKYYKSLHRMPFLEGIGKKMQMKIKKTTPSFVTWQKPKGQPRSYLKY